MKSRLVSFIVASMAALAFSGIMPARNGQQPGTSNSKNAAPGPWHDLTGVWTGPDPQVTFLAGGGSGGGFGDKAPPMTPWAQARFDAAKPGFGPRAVQVPNDPSLRCEPSGITMGYAGNPIEIVQTPTKIVMLFEGSRRWHTIWMDGRQIPKDTDPSWYGYSIGHWDGNMLVVETSGFNDKTWLDNLGDPHSDAMKVEGRYQRVDYNTIEYSLTITDPKAYTQPWVGSKHKLYLKPRLDLAESMCVPEENEKFDDTITKPADNQKKPN